MITLARNLCWESKLTPVLRKITANGGESLCRVIIELTGTDFGTVKSIIARNEGVIYTEMNTLPMLVAEVSSSLLPKLADIKEVKKIREDAPVKALKNNWTK